MIEHLDALKPGDPAQVLPRWSPTDEDPFVKYKVNELIGNADCGHAPVVFEHNPTYYNLFGRIDYRARMGALVTDHMMVKCGAIHEANGGFLVVQAHDLLASPLSWQTLRRILRSGELRIENMGEQYSPLPTSTLSRN